MIKEIIIRASIQGTTLSTRTNSYKAKLIADFGALTKSDFEAGTLKPIIDASFNFDDIVAAHRYMESNKTIGKILLSVDNSKDEL